MKKTILAAIATICMLTAIGQNNIRPQYIDDYLYPHYMASGCYDTNTHIYSYMGSMCYYTAIAQPFYIDSTISIKGIAAFVWPFIIDTSIHLTQPYYLQIRDASLNNILAQVRYDSVTMKQYGFNINTTDKYIECLFDSSIFVNDTLFYVTITWPMDINTDGYECFGSINNGTHSCNNGDYPLLVQTKLSNNTWIPLISDLSGFGSNLPSDTISCPFELTVFPILGTINSGLNEIEQESNIAIYPNPTTDIITIEGKGYNKIKLCDMFGRKQIDKRVNIKPITTLDISKLKAGVYTLELYYNDKHITTKKIIKK
jgi:hypothetical protein